MGKKVTIIKESGPYGMSYYRLCFKFQSHDTSNPKQPKSHIVLSPILSSNKPTNQELEDFGKQVKLQLMHWNAS